jgi:hypothetical protein
MNPWVIMLAWPELGPEGKPTGRELDPAALFAPAEPLAAVPTMAPELPAVAASALQYLLLNPGDPAVTAGALAPLGQSVDDTVAALGALVEAHNADRADGGARLSDPAWWSTHLDRWTWRADTGEDTIRLTHYVVWQVEGRTQREGSFDTPLYAVPADDDSADPSRLRYTRQQVYAGAYAEGGPSAGLARPLVWLNRYDANQAMLQGSVQVRLPGGGAMLLNVHRNNAIPYDRAQPDQGKQARYWYFQVVESLRGYHHGDAAAVDVSPLAAVAGDVHQLGLGRLLVLDLGVEQRLVVLADTGGAFQPNLHQLDLLAGIFPNDAARAAATAHLPARVPVSVLVLRADP